MKFSKINTISSGFVKEFVGLAGNQGKILELISCSYVYNLPWFNLFLNFFFLTVGAYETVDVLYHIRFYTTQVESATIIIFAIHISHPYSLPFPY